MNTITLATKYQSQPKLPDSITAYKKFGVNRSLVSYLCINHFTYPKEFRDTLESYYLLYWEPFHFFSKLSHGIIIHQDTEYIVVYKNTTPAQLKSQAQVKLSFRKPDPVFNLPAYVLVSPV